MSLIIARTLIMAFVLGAGMPATAQSQLQEDNTAAELIELLPYLNDERLDLPTTAGQSSSCSVRLLATALLYRRNSGKYRNSFFATLVIDDYVGRAAGRYNYVALDEVASIIDSAVSAPDGITDDRVKAVIGFCTLKDKNLWVAPENAGRISLARVVRGMALSSLLEGTDEDPLAIANAIDAHTAASHGSLSQ